MEDYVGNPGTETYSFSVDTQSPTMASITPDGDWIGTDSPDITAVVEDVSGSGIDNSSLEMRVDGTPLADCTTSGSGSVTYSCTAGGLAEGEHEVAVYVADNVGNTLTAYGNFSVDTLPPEVTIIQPVGLINDDSPEVIFDFTDPGVSSLGVSLLPPVSTPDTGSGVFHSNIHAKIDSGPELTGCNFTPIEGGYHVTCNAGSLADGDHSTTVWGEDNAGNTQNWWRLFSVDSVAPVVTYTGPTGEINTESTTITATYTDADPSGGFDTNTAAYVYIQNTDTLQSQTSADCTAAGGNIACQVTGLTDGHYTAEVFLDDNAGNEGSDTGGFDVSLVVIDEPLNPFGSLDSVSAGVPGKLDVSGWAIDPNMKSPIDVHIYVNGALARVVNAKDSRPDVGAAFPIYGDNHGFATSVDVAAAGNTVCAYGINIHPSDPAGNVLLGCRVVDVPVNPFGSLDSVSGNGPGKLSVSGWAIDPDTDSPIDVHVYVDGAPRMALSAGLSRPDVGLTYSAYSNNHGYAADVDGITPGSHTVCAYGINTGPGGNALLGCKVVDVPASPFGSLDLASGDGPGQIHLSGWAIDPDTDGPIQVHVWVNGTPVAAGTAGDSRPDVGAAYPGYGSDHGYSLEVPGTVGDTVCVYGINTGPGGNALIGCEVVSDPGNPFGSLDSASVSAPGTVTAAGWAIDPNTADPITVHIYVNGHYADQGTADGSRPDIGILFIFYGAGHGFSIDVAADPGDTVCAYGINTGPGGNALLGCKMA